MSDFELPNTRYALSGDVNIAFGAVDRPRRTIERSQEAVAQGLHLPSAEARKLPAHRLIISIEKVAPGSIAIGAGAPDRVNDILEDHGREHSVDLRGRSRTCQILLHLSEYSVAGVEKREMVGPRNLNQSCAGDASGQLAAAFGRECRAILWRRKSLRFARTTWWS
jgi:hypothetical protein